MNDKVVDFEAYKYELGMKCYKDAMRVAGLYFWMQRYKKELRLKFLRDIEKMKAEGATEEELLSRLERNERAFKVMRFAYDEVAGNPQHSFSELVELCDDFGLDELKEGLLYVRPMTADEISQAEHRRAMMEEMVAKLDKRAELSEGAHD